MNVVENPIYCDFLITPNCNFGCEFCSASSNSRKQKTHQLSLDSITKALHELDEMDVLRVSFEGGEPFLRKDIFKQLSHLPRLTTRICTKPLSLSMSKA